MKKLMVGLFLMVGLVFAQQYEPSYRIGMGMGFSRAESARPTANIIFEMKAPNTEATWATLEFTDATGHTSTMQVGITQRLAKRNAWSLLALGQAGGATSADGAVTAMFGGGGGLGFELGSLWSKLYGLEVTAVVKVIKVNGTDVQLGFAGTFLKSF